MIPIAMLRDITSLGSEQHLISEPELVLDASSEGWQWQDTMGNYGDFAVCSGCLLLLPGRDDNRQQ